MLILVLTAIGVLTRQAQVTMAAPPGVPVLQGDSTPTPTPTATPAKTPGKTTSQTESGNILSIVAQILVTLSLASLFPISVVAYVLRQKPLRLRRLRQDFDLLGYITKEEGRAGDGDVGPWDYDVEAVYERYYGWQNYALHTILTVLVTIIGVSLLFMESAQAIPSFVVNVNTLQAMRYGFLGAYVFSMQLIYRRYVTYDLQPSVYMSCAVTLIAGLAFNYTAFEAIAKVASDPTTATQGAGAGAIAIIAFSLGYFPSLAIKWFDKVAHGALGMRQRRANALPLGLIDGLSQLHESRLGDNGIDNVQNLASADIPELLLNTTFTAEQVIDWVDQAILYLYLDQKSIENFRLAMVRTLSDFRHQWKPYYYDPEGDSLRTQLDNQVRTEKALQFQLTPERLDMLYKSTEHGPNAHHLANYWESLMEEAERTRRDAIRKAAAKRRIERELKAVAERRKKLSELEVSTEDVDRIYGMFDTFQEQWGEELAFESAEDLVNVAFFHQSSGDYGKAIEAYREAMRVDPEYAPAYNRLAWLYADEMKAKQYYPKALELATKAVELSESLEEYSMADTAMFLDTLATVQMRMGMLDKARESLARIEDIVHEAEVYPPTHHYLEGHLNELDELRNAQASAQSNRPDLTDSAAPDEEGLRSSDDNQS
jgi:tetratricopeptide (TPR) repeat protein